MADLRISELAALAGANLAASDLFAVVDNSASETKKITVQDAIGYGVTLIADATIPGAKILFNAGQIAGSAIASSGITATQLANDSVTSAKLADESTVDLVTTLPPVGAYIGQLALDTDNNYSIHCWDGSSWVSPRASGSINTINGSTTGVVNIVTSVSIDTVTISATLDNTTAAAQFLAGPTAAPGAVGYRTIAPGDLPVASTTTKGAVQVNGEGLRMDGNVVEVDNDVTASGGTFSVVNYNAKGLVTGGRAIGSADIPVATAGSTGAVLPGSGLTVTGAGQLNHSNSVTASTATKVTFDAQGHITAGSSLADTDIPNLPASKLTSGTISTSIIGNNSITGTKLANAATVKFGGAGSTAGVVTFPTPDFQGQYFFDALNGDLYLYDGAAWQPITITSGELVYGGTYNAITNQVKTVTAAGGAAGLVVGQPLPNASTSNLRYYVVVADSGTGTAPAPTVSLAPPDMLVSSGTTWDLIDISNAIAGQTATNISFTPYAGIAATNVQTAIQELEDEKLSKAGGIVTGALEIGTTGSLVFEGSVADGNETTIAVTNPTADRTITFPDVTGNVVTTGDTGSVTNTMLAGSIADTKLSTIATAGKVSNSATTAVSTNTASTIVLRDSSGNFSAGTITATFSGTTYLGTTALLLNRSSANQSLTGISSIALAGSTSGNTVIQPSAIASGTITFPATTGTLVTTGDTGSVTSLMIADGTIVDGDISATASIADTKLATISTASKVNCTSLTGTIPTGVLGNSTAYIGTTAVALNRASADQALTGISSIALPGATSGTVTVQPAAVAGATTITVPATTGTLITTGDTGTVTSTMVASGIAGSKISPNFGSQTVTTTGVFSAALGTAAAPSLTFTGDLNTGIYSPGADQAAISTGGTGRLFVSSDGKVGVGTSGPNDLLSLTGGNVALQSTGGAGAGDRPTERRLLRSDIGSVNGLAAIGMNGAGTFGFLGEIKFYTGLADTFNTSLAERMRIDSSGRLLVGTSSAIPGAYSSSGKLEVVSISGAPYYTGSFYGYHNDTNPTVLQIGHSRSSSVGHAILQNGDAIGTFRFEGSDGTNFIEAASITAGVDGTPGTNDMPGRIVLATTADGASSPTERLRISQNGRITVANSSLGTPSAIGNTSGTITLDLATANHFSLTLNANATNTLANPSNQTAGQSGSIVITQDATGSRILAYGSNWKFPGGIAPTLTIAANAVDVLVYYVESATRITARLVSDVK